MITFPKVKAAGYAIGKRLQGFHLLKNPTGTPPTEVNMVKERYGVSRHWDDMFQTTRIKKTFSENGSQKQERYLQSTHYYDEQKSQITNPRKKDILYSVEQDGNYIKEKARCDIPLETIEKRKEPKLSFERSSFLTNDSEYDKMCCSKIDAQTNRGYYKKKYTLGQKIYAFGMHKKVFYPKEDRPNFFKVLYQNLTNKA